MKFCVVWEKYGTGYRVSTGTHRSFDAVAPEARGKTLPAAMRTFSVILRTLADDADRAAGQHGFGDSEPANPQREYEG